MSQIKALALLSGGLDSSLAALLIKNQGVKISGLAFQGYFFDAKNAKKAARKLKLSLKIVDFSKKHLQIVKKPKYGYGKRANPCLDCHLLMLTEAKKIMLKTGFDFLVTGDVLGQRPFSQNKNALAILDKKSCLQGLILRPLSAKLLPPTIPEQKKWIKEKNLLAISGRSRKIQLNLAKKLNFQTYSALGTACILTDPVFSQRLLKLLKINPKATNNELKFLKLGRHFWKNSNLIVVGRNHQENQQIKKIAKNNDLILELKKIPCPTVLIRSYKNKISQPVVEKAKQLLVFYSRRASVLIIFSHAIFAWLCRAL